MKKPILTLLMIAFYGFIQAQITNPEVIDLDSEVFFDEDIVNSVNIKSTINATMYGRIEGPEQESDVYILISPKPTISITIAQYYVDVNGVHPGSSSLGGAVATIIRPKKPGTGGGGRFSYDETQTPQIVLFPNPIQNEVNVSSASNKIIQYRIYDQLGRKLIEGKFIPSENIVINSTSIISGTYFLELEFENNQKKIIQFIKN